MKPRTATAPRGGLERGSEQRGANDEDEACRYCGGRHREARRSPRSSIVWRLVLNRPMGSPGDHRLRVVQEGDKDGRLIASKTTCVALQRLGKEVEYRLYEGYVARSG